MSRKAIVVAATLTMTLGACSSQAAETDKSGGAPQSLTLSIGTPDHEGQPGAAHVHAFVEEVAELSDGRIEVRPRWEVSGESDDWDQRAARMVMEGDLDLAVIPARAWDTEGVDTLRPLQAPFLLVTEEAADATLSSEVADEMLAGVEKAGVTGLGLFPESVRYLFAFGEPARKLEDLRGRGSRTPQSDTVFATHRALGMSPDDPNGDNYAQAVIDGDISVAEASFAAAPPSEAAPVTAVGNLPLFTKVNSLVANTDQWQQLDEGDRDLLLQAAATVQDATTALDLAEAQLASAEEYCHGSDVLSWAEADIEAARAAVEPVYAELEADAESAALLQEVREIADEAGGEPASVPDCTSDEGSPDGGDADAGSSDQSVLDGVYRYTIPEDYLRDLGASEHEVAINAGVLTWTLDGGDYTINWRSSEEPAVERGTYVVDGQRVTFYLSWIPSGSSSQGLPWAVNWKRETDGDLTFTVDQQRDPLLDALFVAAAWDHLK